jgi:hypothetical protein
VIVFRWIVGIASVLFAIGSLLSLAINIAENADLWLRRARRFRHWLWLALLLWFNVEVWGRVVYTIYHWYR